MTTVRKSILVGGLGKFAPLEASLRESIVKAVEADVQRATDNGFDCHVLYLDPNNPTQSLNQLKESLRSQNWDGFSIGFGIRRSAEMTPLFEDVVNASRELAPNTKLLFTTAPDNLYETIRRTFPE